MHKGIRISLTVLVLLVLSGCALSRPSHAAEIARAKQIADGLGRTDANLLAEFEACWDLNSECGYWVYFVSQDDENDVWTKLSTPGTTVSQHEESIATADSSVGMLSLHYAKQLKVTGTNASSNSKTAGVIGWNGKDKDGGSILTRLYKLQVWPKTYSFADKPIKGNVIEVLIRYPNRNP